MSFTHTTTLTWEEDLSFDAELGGHHFKVDSLEKYGGKNRGPLPKPLLLTSLGGCTGMDVASIVGKMRMPYDTFRVEVGGAIEGEQPMAYDRIHIRYVFTGSELDESKIRRAVGLSLDKYCGVAAMLSKACNLTHEIVLNSPG